MPRLRSWRWKKSCGELSWGDSDQWICSPFPVSGRGAGGEGFVWTPRRRPLPLTPSPKRGGGIDERLESAMAFIGKLLVVLHGAVSLGVLAWAGGVYTHRIDWNTPKAKPGLEVAPGLFDKQKAQADQYNIAVDKAYTRWSGNLFQVETLDRERLPRRTFYAGQLELVRTGEYPYPKGTPQREPVQELVYAANGFLDITRPTGRPAFMVRPMVPGDSIAGYDRKMVKLHEDILGIAGTQRRGDHGTREAEPRDRRRHAANARQGIADVVERAEDDRRSREHGRHVRHRVRHEPRSRVRPAQETPRRDAGADRGVEEL